MVIDVIGSFEHESSVRIELSHRNFFLTSKKSCSFERFLAICFKTIGARAILTSDLYSTCENTLDTMFCVTEAYGKNGFLKKTFLYAIHGFRCIFLR